MFHRIDLRLHRTAAHRVVFAACLALAAALSSHLAWGTAEGGGATEPEPSLVGRIGEITGSFYDTARSRLITPSREAAEAFYAHLEVGQLYRRLGDAAMRLVALVDAHLVQPIRRGSGELAAWLEHAGDRPAPDAGPGAPRLAAVAPPAPGLAIPGLGERDIRRYLNGSDPLEPFNRLMFRLNGGLQKKLLGPASQFYLDHTPAAMQSGVDNFFHNLREPATFVSSALQGRFDDAGAAAARFGINTTLGIAGVRDPATGMGYTVRPRNLEETLCSYRLPSGPYLVLPILGPGTLRDAVGRLATVVLYFEVMGSAVYIPYRITDFTVQYATVKDKIDLMNKLSSDPYEAQKALYLAMRTLGCGEQSTVHRELFAR